MKEVFIKEYTVSEVVNEIKTLIETNLYYVKIVGEVSDLKISSNGHKYFNLKDKNSLINAVIFKNTNTKFEIENGMSIKAFARVTIYQDRSNYQLIIEAFEPNGEGELAKIFEKQKNKLQSLGLFDISHKKPIPKNIKVVGIISSPTGAAIKDIEIKLIDRKPIKIFLYPSIVQGNEAENSVIDGINYFNKHKNVDIIIITRGGGSLEDLMCFNGEKLAYSIYNSQLPIITAIGHEIDYTIADFVGDFRLPTPTAVAEFIVPKKEELLKEIKNILCKIKNNIQNIINTKIKKFNYLLNKYNFIINNKKINILNLKEIKVQKIFSQIIKNIHKICKNKYKKLILTINKINKIKKDTKKPIITKNGKIITKSTKISKNDKIKIKIFNKIIIAKVIDVKL